MRLLDELVSDTGHVDVEQWRRAHTDRSPVAICPCGAPAVTEPGPPWRQVSGVRWFSIRCLVCRAEAEVPGNRLLSTKRRRPSSRVAAAAAAQERTRLGDRL